MQPTTNLTTTPLERIRTTNNLLASNAAENKQHQERLISDIATQETIVKVARSFVEYLDNHTSKTEVVNQLQHIGTPDAFRVVEAVNELDQTLKDRPLTDLSEIAILLKGLLEQTEKIPKELPEQQEQKFVDYSEQLKQLNSAVTSVKEAVEKQETTVEAPVVNVAAPSVTVDSPDLKPLTKEITKEFSKAIGTITYPEIPKTDLTTLETEAKKHSKLLNELVLKRMGGGGGGGGRVSPYETNGNPAFVQLNNGAIPTAKRPMAEKITVSGSDTYVAQAVPGTAQSAALWQVKKITVTGGDTVITWADGNSNYDNVATTLSGLSYS
jgi:hypothetical protein